MPQTQEKDVDNYDVILEKIGVGYFHYFLIFLCGFGWLFDGIELALISFILPELKTIWNLSPFQMGFLGSTVFLGMFCGAIVSGALSDVFGRRYIFVYGILATSSLAILSAFSPNYWIYLLLRFIVALGLGSVVPVDFTFLTEHLPPKSRAAWVSFLNIFWSVGEVYTSVLCVLFLQLLQSYATTIPTSGNQQNFIFGSFFGSVYQWVLGNKFFLNQAHSWRWVVFLAATPGILTAILRFFFTDESARFLYSHGKYESAAKVLVRISSINSKFSGLAPIQDDTVFPRKRGILKNGDMPAERSMKTYENRIATNNSSFVDDCFVGPFKNIGDSLKNVFYILFSTKYSWTMFFLFPSWILTSFSGYGFNYAMPLVFAYYNKPMSYLCMFFVVLSGLLSNVFVVLTVDIIPRRIFMVCTYFVTGVATFLCCLYPDLNVILFLAVLSYYLQQAPWALIYCYTTEVFSTKYRSTGLGLCTSSARIGGIAAPMIAQYLFQWNPAYPNVVIGFATALCAVFIFFLPYETHQRYLTDDEGESDKKIDRKYSVHRVSFMFFPEFINNSIDQWVNGSYENDYHSYAAPQAGNQNAAKKSLLLVDEESEEEEHSANNAHLTERLI